MGITGLLSMITRGMSKEGIELTDVKLYEEAVELNNKVKVCIANNSFIVHKVNEGRGLTCWFDEYMVEKVLGLLKEDEWLLGDDIEWQGEWFTLVAEQDALYAESNEYCSYRLLDNNYALSERMTLEDLKNNYTNASLVQGRLK